jgi:hypothetical protein
MAVTNNVKNTRQNPRVVNALSSFVDDHHVAGFEER